MTHFVTDQKEPVLSVLYAVLITRNSTIKEYLSENDIYLCCILLQSNPPDITLLGGGNSQVLWGVFRSKGGFYES